MRQSADEVHLYRELYSAEWLDWYKCLTQYRYLHPHASTHSITAGQVGLPQSILFC